MKLPCVRPTGDSLVSCPGSLTIVDLPRPAQQMVQDKVRFRGVFTDLERERATWQPTDPDSPGRIDASCILVYGLIPEANQGAIVHSPLPQAPQPSQPGRTGRQPGGAASVYGRRIGK